MDFILISGQEWLLYDLYWNKLMKNSVKKPDAKYIIPRIVLNLRHISELCNLHDQLWSRIIPRYIICDIHSREFLL